MSRTSWWIESAIRRAAGADQRKLPSQFIVTWRGMVTFALPLCVVVRGKCNNETAVSVFLVPVARFALPNEMVMSFLSSMYLRESERGDLGMG